MSDLLHNINCQKSTQFTPESTLVDSVSSLYTCHIKAEYKRWIDIGISTGEHTCSSDVSFYCLFYI